MRLSETIMDAVRRAVWTGDAEVLFDPITTEAVRSAARATAGDLDACYLLGWWYWLRYSSSGQEHDLSGAVHFFQRIFAHDPALVPEGLWATLRGTGPGWPGEVAATAWLPIDPGDTWQWEPEDRRSLLGSLRTRVARAIMADDPRSVLSEEAAAEARDAVAGGVGAPKVSYLLGRWHWHRFLVLPEADGAADLQQAVRYFKHVSKVAPLAVPARLWEFYRLRRELGPWLPAAIVDPRFRASYATGLARRYEENDDGRALIAGLALFRSALNSIEDDDPLRPEVLSNQGALFHAVGVRTGEADALSVALTKTRQAVALCSGDDPQRWLYLENLAGVLRAIGERDNDPGLLAEAVDTMRRAVAGSPLAD